MANTQNVSLNFSTEDQSIWSEGSGYSYDWELKDTLGFTPQVKWDVNPTLSIADGNIDLGVFTTGNIGADAGFSVGSGTIDATLPIELSLNLPDSVSVGETVSLTGDYSLGEAASFETTTPYFSAFFDAGFSIEAGASIGILDVFEHDLKAIDIGEEFAFAFDTRDAGISFSEDGVDYSDVADVSSGSTGDASAVSLESSDVMNFRVDTPDLDVSGYQVWNSDGKSLTGEAFELNFVSGSIDVDGLIAEFIPGPAGDVLGATISGDYSAEVAGNSASISWDYFDADFGIQISANQAFDLNTNVAGTVTFEDEVVLADGSKTTEISFDSLDEIADFTIDSGFDGGSDGDIDATVTVDLEATLTNNLDLYFDGEFSLSALEASGSYDTWWGSDSFQEDPIWSQNYEVFSETIDVYTNSFDLGALESASFDISIPISEATALTGTDGNDVLTGTAAGDVIDGLGGADTIDGAAGHDIINGGAGADSLLGGAGNDSIKGGDGDDYLNGGDGDDTIVGGNGTDTMYGGAGYDILDFADGDQGLNFNMQLFGGWGYDAWGNNDDFNDYYHGFEVISGTSADDVMKADVNAGNDSFPNLDVDLIGEAGNDYLSGSGLAQSLDGGTGADTLVGAGGDDTLTGGAGADVFNYRGSSGGNRYGFVFSGTDTITDFSAAEGDVIQLSQNVYGISDLSDVTFDSTSSELFVAGRTDAIAILDGVSSFDVNASIELI